MKIGILVPGHVPEEMVPAHGEYDAHFRRLLDGNAYSYQTWMVVDGDLPDSPDEADGWLITGSKHGVYEAHDWIAPLEAFIRDVQTSGKPLVGICFGHQIIAQALGGKVVKFDGGWAVGRQTYEFNGTTHHLYAWHQDQVIELPQGVTVLGGNEFCEYAALSYGDQIFTVQPHPEFLAPFIQGLLELRAPGVVPDALIDKANRDLEKPVHTDALATMIADVFAKAGTHE